MPIRKVVKKSQAPPDTSISRTGEYSNAVGRPELYKSIQATAPPVHSPLAVAGFPASSTRDLNYFFNLAGSLYHETVGNQDQTSSTSDAGVDAPPSYGYDFQDTQMNFAAVMVIWLFRQTATHVFPITERFHCQYIPEFDPPSEDLASFGSVKVLSTEVLRGWFSPSVPMIWATSYYRNQTY
jgi:hypothetical protein